MCLVHCSKTPFKLNDNDSSGFVHCDGEYDLCQDHQMMMSLSVIGPCSSNSSEDRRGNVDGIPLNNQTRNNNIMLYSASPTSVMDVMSCLPSNTITTATKAVAINPITHSNLTVSSKSQKRNHHRSKYRLTRCSNIKRKQSCPFLLAVFSDGCNNRPQRMNLRNSGTATTSSSSRVCERVNKKKKIHRRNHAIMDFSDVFVVSVNADLNLHSQHSESKQSDSQHIQVQTEQKCEEEHEQDNEERPLPAQRTLFCYIAKSA